MNLFIFLFNDIVTYNSKQAEVTGTKLPTDNSSESDAVVSIQYILLLPFKMY